MDNTAYMVKIKNTNNYWLGGYYGSDNVGEITHGKIYQKKLQAEQVKNNIEEFYKMPAKVVQIIIKEVQDE